MSSPHATTASTPDAWIESASRNAANGVTQHRDVLEHRIVHAPAQLPADQADQRAREHPAAVGEHHQPGHVQRAEVLLADGHADREPVDHQRGAVVDQALRPQHGDDAPGQRPRQYADRGGVGRRDGRARAPTPGPRPFPSACAVAATAAAVATTSAVLASTTTRRLLRISRSDVVRLSQYSSAGRNSSSTTSGGSCARRSAGTNPTSTPTSTSRIAGATGNRRASAPHISSADAEDDDHL